MQMKRLAGFLLMHMLLAASGLCETALPQEVVDLCASAHPGSKIAAQSGGGDASRGQFALALRTGEGYTLCIAEKGEGDAAYALTVDNEEALPNGEPPSLLIDTGGDSLFIRCDESETEQISLHSIRQDGVWGPVDIVYRDTSHPEYDVERYVGLLNGCLCISTQGWDKNENPLSEPESLMPVPVSEAYVESLRLGAFDFDSINPYTMQVRAAPGLCAGLLEAGETLAQVDVQSDCLLMLADREDGTSYIRIAERTGGVRQTGPVPQGAYMDTFHMWDGRLFLGVDDNFFNFSRAHDGGWYLKSIQGQELVSISPIGIGDPEGPVSTMRNDGMYYGRHPWSGELAQLDLLSLPATYEEAAAQLDTSCYALVSNPNPADRLHLRAEPKKGAASLGKFYNRTPVLVLSVEGDWAHVFVGGERGLEGYMMTKYLVMGGDSQQVASAFEQLFMAEGIESLTLLDAPDAARAGAVCELRREDAFFIIGVVGEDWLVLMTWDGTVGYAPRELFWEGNG